MPAGTKVKVVSDLIQKVNLRWDPPKRLKDANLLEHGLLCVLSRELSESKAEATLKALRRDFDDWNVLRVSQVQEVAPSVQGKDDGQNRLVAAMIKQYLQEIFQQNHGFDLEFMREDMAEGAKMFIKCTYLGVPAAYYLLWIAGDEAMPITLDMVRVLDRLGVIPRTTSLRKARTLIEPLVQKKGGELELASHLGEVLERWCDLRRPKCWLCPLADGCPHGKKVVKDWKAQQERIEAARLRSESRAEAQRQKDAQRAKREEDRKARERGRLTKKLEREREREQRRLAAEAKKREKELNAKKRAEELARKKVEAKKKAELEKKAAAKKRAEDAKKAAAKKKADAAKAAAAKKKADLAKKAAEKKAAAKKKADDAKKAAAKLKAEQARKAAAKKKATSKASKTSKSKAAAPKKASTASKASSKAKKKVTKKTAKKVTKKVPKKATKSSAPKKAPAAAKKKTARKTTSSAKKKSVRKR